MTRYRVTFEYENVGVNTALRPIKNEILDIVKSYSNLGDHPSNLTLDETSFTIEEI